uniref:G-protein coupled receptors family 3 profile domain-containing protein n=1 Tax=Leptobrachium leishanense TaxID=445787 RepID=A0A8C5PID3_9ANUR
MSLLGFAINLNGSIIFIWSLTKHFSKCNMFKIKEVVCFLFCFILVLESSMNNSPKKIGATFHGDIIIGGLFPIHKEVTNLENFTVPHDFQCKGFEMRGFIRSLGMVHAIERINSLNLLPGITLGYEIYDTCGDGSKGVYEAMRFLYKRMDLNSANIMMCNFSHIEPSVKAIVGADYSEESIAVSRLFRFQLIPQISYGSSANILSDKRRFPSFLRTVPSDTELTAALALLIDALQWNYVGIISSEDAYGRSVTESLLGHFDDHLICAAFKKKIPSDIGNPAMSVAIKNVIAQIKQSPAHGIIIALKVPIVMKFFSEIIKENITRTWIGTDIWSSSREVTSMEGIETVGNVLGFSFKNGEIQGFRTYLQNLQTGNNTKNPFIDEYKMLHFGCTEEYKEYKKCLQMSPSNCTKPDAVKVKSPLACSIQSISVANDDYLVRNIELDGSYSAYLAVMAIANALKTMLCVNGTCMKNTSFAPWELLHNLKNVQFSDNDHIFSFDDHGDAKIGYDLLLWRVINGSMQYDVVGWYDNVNRTIQLNNVGILWNNPYNEIPESKCSDACVPGQYKIHSDIICCYNCGQCAEGYFSTEFDVNQCTKCPVNQWSSNGSSQCQNRTIVFLNWEDPFAIILISFAAIGILLVLLIAIVFLKNVTTPAVKAAGGIYTFLMNLSLLASFFTTAFFIGEPSNVSCMIRQPLYGISFTLCVSCILIKSFRIVLAFELGDRVHYNFKGYKYKPVLVIMALTSVQVGICILWLVLQGPSVQEIEELPETLLLQCNEGSPICYGTMLGYTGFLSFICFVLAYKGRNLPDIYNEGRLITFSMLIYLFVWFVFIPVYMTTSGIYRPAVELMAILSSNYGVICCHLIPTTYVIFFKKSQNNRQEYFRTLRAFSNGNISVSYINDHHPCFENKDTQTLLLENRNPSCLTPRLNKRRRSC